MMADHARNRAVYVISVAAELAGVHPQTLRIYERKGLLDPARTAGGSRRYSERDLERLQRIAELTDEGLNLAGVKRVLELEAEIDGLRERARASCSSASTTRPSRSAASAASSCRWMPPSRPFRSDVAAPVADSRRWPTQNLID